MVGAAGGSSSMAKKALGWFLFVLVAIGLVGCDHATKLAAQTSLAPRGTLTVVPGLVELVYAENRDSAFSLFRAFGTSASRSLLLGLAVLAVGVVAIVAAKRARQATSLERLGYALMFAGAVGNVADRAWRGYVVDFIHVHHWPIFNVADIAVALGGVALVVSMRHSALRKPPLAPETK